MKKIATLLRMLKGRWIAAMLISSLMLTCHTRQDDKKEITQLKFERTKWATQKDGQYPYRDMMLKDLVDNVPLKGLNHKQLLGLLGEPNRTDNSHFFYTVFKKHLGNTMVVLHSKTLVVKLGADSTVEWWKIHQ